MNAPVHFDPKIIEAEVRRLNRENTAEAMRLAPDQQSRDLVRLQEELVEVVVHATLWHVRNRADEQPDSLMAKALGATIAMMLHNFAANTGNPSAAMIAVLDAVCGIFADSGELTTSTEGTVHGTVGGLA